MEQDLEKRVKDALEAEFRAICVDIEVLPDGRVSGLLVSTDFDELDQVDRQKRIRDTLQQALGVDAQRVGVLLPYTPAEMESMNAA